MKNKNIVELSHYLLKDMINDTDICIDMTLGNGHDSLFLAKNCKHVYSYEIQDSAITNSIILFKKNAINNITIVNESHENIKTLNIDYQTVIFNLGYLPNGDKTITTKATTTISAINTVLSKPSLDRLFIVIYPGHEAGLIESDAIDSYIMDNDLSLFRITKITVLKTKNPSPYIIMFEKK